MVHVIGPSVIARDRDPGIRYASHECVETWICVVCVRSVRVPCGICKQHNIFVAQYVTDLRTVKFRPSTTNHSLIVYYDFSFNRYRATATAGCLQLLIGNENIITQNTFRVDSKIMRGAARPPPTAHVSDDAYMPVENPNTKRIRDESQLQSIQRSYFPHRRHN